MKRRADEPNFSNEAEPDSGFQLVGFLILLTMGNGCWHSNWKISNHKEKRRFSRLLLAVLVIVIGGVAYYWSHMMEMWPFRQTVLGRYRMETFEIQSAYEAYRKEYGHWPAFLGRLANHDELHRSSGAFIQLLVGHSGPENPKAIRFLDYHLARNGVFGLIDDDSDGTYPENIRIVDAWGEAYYVVIDVNDDGEVSNPEATVKSNWFTSPRPKTLRTRVATYSSGPDRDPKTWEDNITSWR